MIVEHFNDDLNSILQEMLKYSIKNEILIDFVLKEDYFGYRLNTGEKIYRGIIIKHSNNKFEKYYEDFCKNENDWIINNKKFKNPYLCCDNSFINITKDYIEKFCIHSSYIHDEILLLII